MMTAMPDSHMSHDTVLSAHSWADIDLSAVQHNFRRARELACGSRLCAVVKANAYGHGAPRIAAALHEVMQPDDLFAVVTLREALSLRQHIAHRPILLMRGPLDANEMAVVLQQDFFWVLHSAWQLSLLQQAWQQGIRPAGGKLNVWLKTNTGMSRLGMPISEVPAIWQQVKELDADAELILMSHLACADDLQESLTPRQLQNFKTLADELGLKDSGHCTLAASAGILNWPQTHFGIVRPGIMLYGASPMIGREGPDEGLQPVMNLKSRLIAVNQVRAGDTVGYGATFTAPQDMQIGVIGIGYGDGYPRHAPSGTPVVIHAQGKAWDAALAGRVSMDMLTVDLTGIPAQAGDEVLLWGQAWGASLPADRIARLCHTIAYELFCQITARVEYRYR
jgi:alanine racemase